MTSMQVCIVKATVVWPSGLLASFGETPRFEYRGGMRVAKGVQPRQLGRSHVLAESERSWCPGWGCRPAAQRGEGCSDRSRRRFSVQSLSTHAVPPRGGSGRGPSSGSPGGLRLGFPELVEEATDLLGLPLPHVPGGAAYAV